MLCLGSCSCALAGPLNANAAAYMTPLAAQLHVTNVICCNLVAVHTSHVLRMHEKECEGSSRRIALAQCSAAGYTTVCSCLVTIPSQLTAIMMHQLCGNHTTGHAPWCTRNECLGHCGWITPGRGRKLMQQCELVQMHGVAVLQQVIVEFWTVQVAIYRWSIMHCSLNSIWSGQPSKKTRLLAKHQKRHAKQVPRQFFCILWRCGQS